MPRRIAEIDADIARLEELRAKYVADGGSDVALLIEESVARLEGDKEQRLARQASKIADRHASLDGQQLEVDAMLLEKNLSAYVTKRLERMKIRLEKHREAIES